MKKNLLVMLVILFMLTGCANDKNTSNSEYTYSDKNIIAGIRITQPNEKTHIEANLCCSENITLNIDKSEIVVKNGTDDYDIDELRNRYSLVDAGLRVIAVVEKVPSANGEYVLFELYKYNDKRISKVWSACDLSATIQNVNTEDGQLNIYFPQFDISHKLQFTEDEQSRWEQKLSELKNSNIEIDENYYTDIKDNLIISPLTYHIVDLYDSGIKEILILSEVKTVGAKTPSIRDHVVFIIENKNGAISTKDIVFEREQTDTQSPFAYFN
jgi:hypothetical protein